MKIVVVGGGTAGWVCAATLARVLGPMAAIELIESDDIGTVGVGEATIPQIRLLVQALGINEDDFLRHVDGTIKLGIQFEGWGRPDEAYMHAFGSIGRSLGMLPFHPYWVRARKSGHDSTLWDYSFNYQAAAANRFDRVAADPQSAVEALVYAYHFDATRVARYLRVYAERLGVRRTEGRVVDVALRPEDGFIDRLRLADRRTVAGDLYIDCSGFRALLIGEALGTPFEDWSGWLPCDRAVAVPSAADAPTVPYTRAIARDAGWQWRIPLQSRVGNGYVYCSDCISDDEATATLLANLDGDAAGEPRQLRFAAGVREAFWRRNCVALGLAGGFLEPLESTSIHLVQSGVDRLLKMFPGDAYSPAQVAEYNRLTRFEFERIRDFLVLHYHANGRDGEFWRSLRHMEPPPGLAHRLAVFRDSGGIFREAEELFTEVAWLQVLVGQGEWPERYHPLADRVDAAQLNRFLAELGGAVATAVDRLPSHGDFIRDHCAAL